MKFLIKKILRESEFNWVQDELKDDDFELIRDAQHRHEIAMTVIKNTKNYSDWEIYIDNMSGSVMWEKGRYTGYASPEWNEEYIIPVDISVHDNYFSVGEIVIPKNIKYVMELQDWYINVYFKEVNKMLSDWIEENG